MEETSRNSYDNDGDVSPRPPPSTAVHPQPPYQPVFHQNTPPPPPHPFSDYQYPDPPIRGPPMHPLGLGPLICLQGICKLSDDDHISMHNLRSRAEIVDTGNTVYMFHKLDDILFIARLSTVGVVVFYLPATVRSHFNLMETQAPDWLIHFICPLCALCQEHRELQMRGLCPALGWKGVRDLPAARAMIMDAPVHQTMT